MKKLSFLVIAFLVLGVSVLATPKTASATNINPCQILPWLCNPHPTHTPTPTPSATPTVSPTPSETPNPCEVYLKLDSWEEEENPCPTETPTATPTATPSATPEATPTPEVHFSEPGPASAPTQPLCGLVPTWAPTVKYHGQKGNTFSYSWSTVQDGLHDYWVDYGFTPQFLPFSLVVKGKESVELTMFGGTTNWMRVAGYVEPGCKGPFSAIVN